MPWEKSEPMDQRVEFCVKAADIAPKKIDAAKENKKAA
jgi:hypothetical protein